MNVNHLAEELVLHASDPDFREVSRPQAIMFISSASRDARANGWLVPHEDDESIVVEANTYEYPVPQPFAFVEKLYMETTDGHWEFISNEHWETRINDGSPVFVFNLMTPMNVGKRVKVVGQKRPTLYNIGDQVIDNGMESFMRERALYFIFRFLGAGNSELSRWRQTMSQQSWVTSEDLLRRHPAEYRVRPSSRVVPGR